MKPDKLFEIIGRVDESFVAEAAEYPQRSQRAGWVLRFAAAACLVLVIGASAWFIHQMNDSADDGLDFMPAGPVQNGERAAADFLGQFTSLFSFVVVTDYGYTNQHGTFITQTPLVRWDGAAFLNPDGEIIQNVPFILEGNRVATHFSLLNFGVGVPVVLILYTEYRQGSIEPVNTPNYQNWQMFQYIDGGFLPVRFDRAFDYAPSFFLDNENRIIMAARTEFIHVRLNNGVMEFIESFPATVEGTPDVPGMELVSGIRLHELEREITEMMRQRFDNAQAPTDPYGAENWDTPEEHRRLQEGRARAIIPAFNEVMRVFRYGLETGRMTFEYDGRWYFNVTDPGFQSLQDIRELVHSAFWSWPGDPAHQADYVRFFSDTPFFREFDGVLARYAGNMAIFERDGYLLLPQIHTGQIEYVRTTQDSVFVRVDVWVEYMPRGAESLGFYRHHTMTWELMGIENGELRIAGMELAPYEREITLETMYPQHVGALTGAITIYGGYLWLDPVELVWRDDHERVAELRLAPNDFHRGHFQLHPVRPQTQRFAITPDTLFEFMAFNEFFRDDVDDNPPWISATDPEYFRIESPNEFLRENIGRTLPDWERGLGGRIIHFVHIDPYEHTVIRVVQEFAFTQ